MRTCLVSREVRAGIVVAMTEIQRADDNMFFWDELHEGRGSIRVRRYFEGKFRWPVDLEVWEIPVGGSEGVHRHDAFDPDGFDSMIECYVVVTGSGRFTVGDQVMDARSGDAVLVDPETDRGVENTGSEPLKLVVLYQMAGEGTGALKPGDPPE